MEFNLETKQQLANLLAQPATVTQADTAMLSSLAKNYPYYQPLHLLLARASLAQPNQTAAFATAALYNGGERLYQILYQPASLTAKNLINNSETLISATASEFAPTADFMESAIETEEHEIFEEIAEIEPLVSSDEVTEKELTEALPNEMAIENIVAQDFFAFEKNFATSTPKPELVTATVPLIEEYDQEAEEQTVSKYNDDKLPYTFLWWLAKTRKEHEQIFQPYVTKKQTSQPGNPNELQQQYVEHIFHLQTPFNAAEEASKGPLNKTNASKGDTIIANFIKNEPQIRAPKLEQINNENKAKKSAEDQDDLVSETLAAIYIEQMLYQKAIVTYEKLSLKFPEKSRYFANLIQSLEKKI